RFFAEDVLAGLGGGDGDFRVRIVGRVDVHDVNVRAVDDFAPVGRGIFPAELDTRGFDALGIASADGLHLDVGLERKKTRRLTPGVGVRLAHETIADHPDTQCFAHRSKVLNWRKISPAELEVKRAKQSWNRAL